MAVSAAKRLWSGWKYIGEKAAYGIGFVVFTILYWIAFAPLAFFLKVILGRRFLPTFSGNEPTYFMPSSSERPSLERMKRQG